MSRFVLNTIAQREGFIMDKEALRTAAERIRRFQRMGGIDLSKLHPEENSLLSAEIRSGIAPLKKARFRFRCPICNNVVTNDQEMEPLCTGPGWTDDHPPEVMELML